MKKWFKKLWKKLQEWLFGDETEKFDYSSLDWCYGGENGSKAVEDTSGLGYRIDSVSANTKGITFSGTGTMWGNDHSHAYARNCIFFEENGVFHGGFWEWGSSDRKYRGFDNIYSGYKGWNAQRFLKSKKWLFFIMTKGGASRSNLVFIDR